MSNNRYMVTRVADITPEIIGKLKNFYQNPDYLFIEDTYETVTELVLTRIDTQEEYCILKVAPNTPTAQIKALLPDHNGGNDKFKKIYNGNAAFITFLIENFE